ncbi:MAG: hypothetical protein O2782_03455 [bacterium]|nr:hypothetical protein [bacterium]
MAWATGCCAAIVILVSPFHAVFCTVTTWAAWLCHRWFRPDPDAWRLQRLALATSAAGLLPLLAVLWSASSNRWMSSALSFDGDLAGTGQASLALCVVVIAAVVARHRRRGPQRSDIVLLCVLAVEPLAAIHFT